MSVVLVKRRGKKRPHPVVDTDSSSGEQRRIKLVEVLTNILRTTASQSSVFRQHISGATTSPARRESLNDPL